MTQYISGRQPFLNVGIPGITTNTPVLDITGRVGIGTTNPSADLDLSTIRIRQSISDVNNFSGELGYFLTKDNTGLIWTAVPPLNNNALFVSQDGVILGVSSYTGLNFISNGDDLIGISTNNSNPNIVDIRVSSRWDKDGNTGIYTSKFVGIGSTNPTVALDVIGSGKFTGIVTAGKFSGQSGIITGNIEVGSLIVTGISTFVGVTTFSKVGIGLTTIPRTTLDVGGDVWVSGVVTATTFNGRFLDFENINVTGIATINTGIVTNLRVNGVSTFIGISTFGTVGIGTTNIISNDKLTIIGDVRLGGQTDTFRVGTAITMSNGVITATTFNGRFLDFEHINVSGIATINSGIVTNLNVSGVSTFVGIATFGTVGIGTTAIIGSDVLTIIGDVRLGGQTDTFRVGTAITMSNGIITATTFSGRFLDFGNIKVSGISTFTNGPVFIGSETSTGTASQSLQVTGGAYVSGNIGLGSTNPTSKLFVVGDGYFTGVITATEFKGNASTATYATDAGIATNLKGGVANNLPYQSSPNTTSFITNGSSGTFLKSNGFSLPPSWESLPTTTINVAETVSALVNFPLFINASGNTSTLSINSSLFSFVPQSNNPRLGIGTGSPAYNLDVNGKGRFIGTVGADVYYGNGFVGSALSISGIATVSDTFKVGTAITMNAGIITAITFIGNLTGTASTASLATTAFNLDSNAASNLNVAYATNAGIATNVIGGIASVTSLFVDTLGISTLGTVKISSGIITATSGIVTYYGDGQYLDNVSGVRVEFQELTGHPVYPTLANNTGVSSIGIIATGDNALVFIPSNGSLGIGTTNPTSKLWINGNGYFTGVVTSSGFYVDGELIGQGGISGTNLVGTALSISGISTLGTVKISSGIITSTTGVAVTFYGDFVGTASSAGYATTAFNLDSNAASNLNVAYATNAGVATYATNAGIATNVIGGIASVTSLFVDTLGISTLGTVKISSGIITSTTGTAVTYYGDFVGTASSAGYATTAFNLDSNAASNLNVAYATNAGVATDVIGGIASVSSLFVDTLGISTLGTVKISSGIITSTTGTAVTYYGDGSKLTGVIGVRVEFQELVGDPTYPTLANNSGVSSVGIATTGTNALVFIPNRGSLGIGTTNPTSKLWVNGDGYFVGVVTATTFNGNLTGIASTATNLAGGAQGSLPYQNSSGITSFLSAAGTNNQVLLYNTGTNKPYWGSVSSGSGAFDGINVKDEDGSSVTGIKTLNFRGDNISAVSDTTSGISTITVSSNLVGTALSISGISTLGTVKISSGIVTSTTGIAVTFYGDFVGTASSAGYATTAFNLNGVVESNLNVAYAQTAGTASSVALDSVGLGTHTYGDYVRDITGTANEITVTGGTGEGSTPTLSLPNLFTVPQDLKVIRDVQIDRNLNVNGNITIGGTSAYILVDTFRVSDPDIILGFRTDAFDNDVSNDTTASHGGIAVASTEGNPLVNFNIAGIETLPATYKKIMWFKAGEFAGLGTDAWLSNYAVGIGSTQFPSGTRLAAGSVQFTENDLAVVKNINSTGIITANEFSGKLNATSALSQSVGFATTATNLADGAPGSLPYQNASGITSFVSAGTNNQVLLYNTGTNKPYWGSVSSGSGAFTGITVRDEDTTSLSNIVTVDIFGSNITATSGGTGIASIRVSDNLVGTALSISGISTFTNGPVFIGSGTSTGTASQPLQVTGGAYVSDNLGIGTINPDRKLHVQGDIKITGGIYDINNNPGSSNRVLSANGSGGWSWQPVTSIGAISGIAINDDFSTDASRYLLFTDATSGTISTEYVSATQLVFNPSSGNLGIGTTVPTEKLQVNGNISINGTTSYGSITAITATTSQIGIHSTLSTSTYRSVEYTIQATQGTNYHVTKILSIHDGTITYNSEYGTIYNNALVGTFDVDISGGNMRLLVTPASSSSTSYTINFITTKI